MLLRGGIAAIISALIVGAGFAIAGVHAAGPWSRPDVADADVGNAAMSWLTACAGADEALPRNCPQAARDTSQSSPTPFTWLPAEMAVDQSAVSWDATSGEFLVTGRVVMKVRHDHAGHTYEGRYVSGFVAGVRLVSDTRDFGGYSWFGQGYETGGFVVLDVSPSRFAWYCCSASDVVS